MRIQRRPVTDDLTIDGEMVVLVDDKVLVLSQVASTALNTLSTGVWTSLGALTATLEAAFGLPEDNPHAVTTLVSALDHAGLVRVEP